MRTIIKTKISLIDNGNALMLFIWKPHFKNFLPSILGTWNAHGTTHCSGGIDKKHINSINTQSVGTTLYNNFISPKKYK